jgi:hypothetical protein
MCTCRSAIRNIKQEVKLASLIYMGNTNTNLTSLGGWTLGLGIPVYFFCYCFLGLVCFVTMDSVENHYLFPPKIRCGRPFLPQKAFVVDQHGTIAHTSQKTKQSCVQCKPSFTSVPKYSECTSIDGTNTNRLVGFRGVLLSQQY